ncbi:chromatin binding protein, partial [Ascosphaera pollenicola]
RFRDVRSPANMAMSYTESHNDDIAVLQFSPFNPRLLLSGSTDTLVNIYDTSQADEEEALKQVINHGSVHRAGFLSANASYVLSHDEHFAIYPLNAYVRGEAITVEQGEKVAEEPKPVDFKDVRGQLRCNYVAQVIRGSEDVYIASGMPGQSRFDLMPIAKEPQWRFDESGVVRLPGAHGEEVVRGVVLDEENRSLFTCGEDGFVRAWQLPAAAPEVPQIEDSDMQVEDSDMKSDDEGKGHKKHKKHDEEKHGLGKEKRRKKKEHRYKPY